MSYFPEFYSAPNYKPNKTTDLVCTFRIESRLPLDIAATIVATESSIGTWTGLTTLNKKIIKYLAPRIFFLDKKNKIAKIAYDLNLFEPGNIPQLLSSVAGNIFSVKEIEKLRLEDIDFPKNYAKKFLGPAFGIQGIRKYFGNRKHFLLGSIIKPKLGLTYKEHAEVAYEVWKNGVDIVKDDENLTSLSFNPFNKRVDAVMKLQALAEKETKKKKLHAFNITGLPDQMLERAKYVKKMGGKCIMIDIVSCGFGSIQFIRQRKLGLIIHGHRAGHSAFTRDPKHGISMLVLAKLARMAGIDQLHTGTVVGKMDGEKKEVLEINKAIKENFYGLKPVMPIASGGLYPGLLEKLHNILGDDVIVNLGGGIHGHPKGSEAGAIAAFQAREAIYKNISLLKYAGTHKELAEALKKWGT